MGRERGRNRHGIAVAHPRDAFTRSGGTGMTTTMPATIELQTQSAKEVVDITKRVEALIGGATGGSCHLFLKHTTAGLLVGTNESGVPGDIIDVLPTLHPQIPVWHDFRAYRAA